MTMVECCRLVPSFSPSGIFISMTVNTKLPRRKVVLVDLVWNLVVAVMDWQSHLLIIIMTPFFIPICYE